MTATAASVRNATITSLSVTSHGTGYSPLPITTFSSSALQSALSISAGSGTVLTISADGTVTWNGPPSRGAKTLINAIKGHLDLEIIGAQAMERSYRRAIEKCLTKAKEMDKSAFIAMLEDELEIRTSKSVLMSLTEGD